MDIKRLDHLGIVAGVIKDLGLIEAIDERLQKDKNEQEHISPGEAIAGMIINGLGFSDKPLSLTPRFYETKALEQLFRPGVKAEHFNRHKLGKVLDASHAYGCETLFYELAQLSCRKEQIDNQLNSLDTTTFSVTGEYAQDVDEHTITLAHGYSKDHRPDLKQVVHELMVSQDGGVPLMMKSWDGNVSDNKIFKERASMLIAHFKQAQSPRYLIADSKLYSQSNAATLPQLPFITRIPSAIKEEGELIAQAIAANQWEPLDDSNRYYCKSLTHYGMAQRWLVVYSDKARERSKKTLEKACEKERQVLNKKLWHLSCQPYDCAKDAEKALKALVKQSRYHTLDTKTLTEKPVYATKGRPKTGDIPISSQYFIQATIKRDEKAMLKRLDEKSCYVLGSSISARELEAKAVIDAYKQQNSSIENQGFRFLKDPLFFVSSLFLKKPSRIMGLLMVMTLALLVYAIAQRRLRRALADKQETLPNQINQLTKTPTLRWLFQLMEGIYVANIDNQGVTQTIITGLDAIKQKIIAYLGDNVMAIYADKINSIS